MARYAVRNQGIAMAGFTQLQRALLRIAGVGDYGLAYELRRRLALIGETVAEAAPQYVTHKTGRHGNPDEPRLEDSVRVNVTTNMASVYSTAIHGGVQNVGGQVGRKRRTLLKRADVSQWMNKAVNAEKPYVEEELEGVIDWLVHEFEAEP